jgi:hypothetical protein
VIVLLRRQYQNRQWLKGQKMIAEVNKAVSNPKVKALLKKHLTQMSNLPDVPEEPGTKQKEDEI